MTSDQLVLTKTWFHLWVVTETGAAVYHLRSVPLYIAGTKTVKDVFLTTEPDDLYCGVTVLRTAPHPATCGRRWDTWFHLWRVWVGATQTEFLASLYPH